MPISRKDLDSHDSVVVSGINVQIISDAGRTAEVSPFMPDYESTHQFPSVGTTIRHDNQHTGNSCAFTVRDSLDAHSIAYNLILIFSMRDSGIGVKTILKFQIEDLLIYYHLMCFPKENFRAPLKLRSVFSYFL